MRISLKRQANKDDPTFCPLVGELRCFYLDPGDLSEYGWFPCDGGVYNGVQTPNLNGVGQSTPIGSFVVGAEQPGLTGGKSLHNHSPHSVTPPQDHEFVPTGAVSQPSFIGTPVHLEHEIDPGLPMFEGPQMNPAGVMAHDFTPAGTVTQPSFTGNRVVLQHTGLQVSEHSTAEHLPPYVTVKWYMYCGTGG